MIKTVFPILALCLFSTTLGIGTVAPLLPLYLRDIGVTGIGLGVTIAAYFASNSIAVPIMGRLSDQKGRKIFLTVGFLLYSIISLGYLLTTDIVMLITVRFIQGIAEAATIPIAFAYLGDLTPEGEEGRWMSYGNAVLFSGFGFGPLIGGLLAERFGMTAAFLSMSGLNLLAFFIALMVLPETQSRRASEGAQLSLREIAMNKIVRGLFSCRVALSLGIGGIATFLPIFAATIGLRTNLIGTLLSVNILAVTLFTPLAGILADRLNRRILTSAGSLILAFSLATIPLAGGFWPLLTILLGRGLGVAIFEAAASALTVEEGRGLGMGSTMSVMFLAFGIGMASGPIASGGISELLSINSVFYFGGVMGLLGTGLFIWFVRPQRQSATV